MKVFRWEKQNIKSSVAM